METIHRAGQITFDEIARQWLDSSLSGAEPLSKRTFHNHKQKIEEIFGINIGCDRATDRYYMDDTAGVSGQIAARWLLNSLSVGEMMRGSKAVADRILLEDIPSANEHLSVLTSAMRDNSVVTINYSTFRHPDPQAITLYPYFIKLYDKRWYLYGQEPESDAIKVYALDNILSVDVTRKHFRMPKDFSAGEYLYPNIGVSKYKNIKPQQILLKVFGESVKYLRISPLHHTQKEEESLPYHSLFSYRIEPTPEFYNEILSHRNYVEIVSPESVRDEFSDLLAEISWLYEE